MAGGRTLSEDHFSKTPIVLGKICITFTAVKIYVSQHGGLVVLRRKAPIRILYVLGGDGNFLRHFEKVVVVTAFGANNPLAGPGKFPWKGHQNLAPFLCSFFAFLIHIKGSK